MHYNLILKNNKIYYFKVTQQKKVRVSEDEYNKYAKRKYNTKIHQKGGYHASPEFENLSGKLYENNYLQTVKLNKHFKNLFNKNNNNENLGKGISFDGVFINYYEPEVRYGVYGYTKTTNEKGEEEWKRSNLGVFPVLSLAQSKSRDYVNKICEYQAEKGGKMGLILSKNSGDEYNGFLDINKCKEYRNGKYYTYGQERKSVVMSLAKTDAGWINQDIIYEYPGEYHV